jgi:hypothetical protein
VERLDTIQIAGDSITKEAIAQKMGKKDSPCSVIYEHEGKAIKYTQLSIFANELINLINSGGNPIGMIDFFTDIWDRDKFVVETKNMGNDIIMGPYVPILGCLTPDTIKFLLSQKVVSGGMVRRCIFVQGTHLNQPNALPRFTEEQELARESIFEHLQHVAKASGPMDFTDEAKDAFVKFYNQNHYRKPGIRDKVLASFLETKPELVLKIAILIQLSKFPIEYALTQESVEASVMLLDNVEMGASNLFSSTGRNDLSPIAESIYRILDSEPTPLNRKEVYKLFFKDATMAEIDQCIESLRQTDKVTLGQFTDRGVNITLVSTKEKMQDYVDQMNQRKASKD